MCELLRKIEAIADPKEDKLLLLIGQLVDDRFRSISKRLDKVDTEIAGLTSFVVEHQSCPVIGNEENARILLLFAKYPKMSVTIFLGFVALAFTSFGANLQKILPLFQ